MKYETIYICEYCNTEFRYEEECREHEKRGHVEINRYESNLIEAKYFDDDSFFPDRVILPMKNGDKVLYKFLEVLPIKKESPQQED